MLQANKLTFTIKRDPRSYEEFFMVIYTGTQYTSFYTKHFSNCLSDTVKVELDVAYNFVLRTRMVNENSNYTINVHQDFSSKANDLLVIILVSVGFSISMSCTILCAILV